MGASLRKRKYRPPQYTENSGKFLQKNKSYNDHRLVSSSTSVGGFDEQPANALPRLSKSAECVFDGVSSQPLVEAGSTTLVTTLKLIGDEAKHQQSDTVLYRETGAATNQGSRRTENNPYVLECNTPGSPANESEQEYATAGIVSEMETESYIHVENNSETVVGISEASMMTGLTDNILYTDSLPVDIKEPRESQDHTVDIVEDITNITLHDKESSKSNESVSGQGDAVAERLPEAQQYQKQEVVILRDHHLLAKASSCTDEANAINVEDDEAELSANEYPENVDSLGCLLREELNQGPVEGDGKCPIEDGRQRNSSIRKKYKVRLSCEGGPVPPLPPRKDVRQNETDNAPGVQRRRNVNALSLVLPLEPSQRQSKRHSGSTRSSPDGASGITYLAKHPAANVDNGINILPLPPKSKARTLPSKMEPTAPRRFKRNAAAQERNSKPRSSCSFKSTNEYIDHHPLPRRAQTLHRDKFDEDEAQFLCLLDLPLMHKGSVVSPEKLSEKNVHDFLMAAKKGETDFVRTILTKLYVDINVADQDGMTALHYACRSGNPDTVSLLIDRGACINSKTIYGSEPLMVALREKPEKETARKWHQRDVAQVVHELVSAGASVHTCDGYGLSTLLVAISVENNYTTDYLLDNGANPNYPLHFRSVLHVVSIQVSRGIAWIEIERKMLEIGANPNVVDCCGNTPASLLFYSEFTPFHISDIEHYIRETSGQNLEYEKYMELPAVLRLSKPNKNTFGYTRKRLNRLLRHLRAGLDMNKMPPDLMIHLDKFLLREQNGDVLKLFYACGHYPDVGILQTFVPNQLDNFEELWELLESPASLMLTAASVVRVHTKPSAHMNAKYLPLPKSIIAYVTLDAYEDIFQSVHRSSLN